MPVYRVQMTMAPGRVRPGDEGRTFQVDFWAQNLRCARRLVRQYLFNRYLMAFTSISTIRARKGTTRNTAGDEFVRAPDLDKGPFLGWRKIAKRA